MIAAMIAAIPELPDDIEALKAMVLARAARSARLEERTHHLEAVNKATDERIAALMAIVKMLERARYGRRSKRLGDAGLNDDQYAFVLDEIETGIAAIQEELQAANAYRPKRAPPPRKGFAPHLERIEHVIEPEIPPGCGGLEKVLIGEDVSERLDVTAARFRVIVTRRPKYAFRGRDGVIQAPAPAHSRMPFPSSRRSYALEPRERFRLSGTPSDRSTISSTQPNAQTSSKPQDRNQIEPQTL